MMTWLVTALFLAGDCWSVRVPPSARPVVLRVRARGWSRVKAYTRDRERVPIIESPEGVRLVLDGREVWLPATTRTRLRLHTPDLTMVRRGRGCRGRR